MSCHDIGRGLNNVVKVIYETYDEGNISKESAIRFIKACQRGVGCCDGNEYEAVQSLIDNQICGCCLEKRDKTINFWSSINRKNIDYRRCLDILDQANLGTEFSLCEDCLDDLCKKYDLKKVEVYDINGEL